MRVAINRLGLAFGPISLAVVLAAGAAQAAPVYHSVDLGDLGATNVYATAINDAGQIAGTVTSPGNSRAFRYSGGVMTDIGFANNAGAYGINASGQVTGYTISSSLLQAFIYPNGTLIQAGATTIGTGINGSQQVTGYYSTTVGGTPHAFRYSNGVWNALDIPGGSVGSAINASGAVAGYTLDAGNNSHAFVANPGGGYTALGLPGVSVASAINTSGQITGYYIASAGNYQAYVYANGHSTTLGTLGGGWSAGESLNDRGDVAGWSLDTAGIRHAMLYLDGTIYNIEDLLAAGDPLIGSFRTTDAYINDSRQVAVDGCYTTGPLAGTCRAYLLTPESITADVPEPVSWSLLAVGLGTLALGERRRRRRVQ